jgi:hypothetical protein
MYGMVPYQKKYGRSDGSRQKDGVLDDVKKSTSNRGRDSSSAARESVVVVVVVVAVNAPASRYHNTQGTTPRTQVQLLQLPYQHASKYHQLPHSSFAIIMSSTAKYEDSGKKFDEEPEIVAQIVPSKPDGAEPSDKPDHSRFYCSKCQTVSYLLIHL